MHTNRHSEHWAWWQPWRRYEWSKWNGQVYNRNLGTETPMGYWGF